MIVLSWLCWFMAGTLKALLYNPCSLHNDRLTEIVLGAAAFDIIALPATQQRQTDPLVPVTRSRIVRHTALSWGWKKTSWSNKSCGITIALGPRLANGIKKVFVPPVELTGRVGAVRIRNKTVDLTVFVPYLPPRGIQGENYSAQCALAVLRWIEKILQQTPQRSMPIILGDLNDSFGLVKTEEGTTLLQSDFCVGDELPGVQHKTAEVVRDWATRHSMSIATTFWHTGFTFFNGHKKSKIDHIIIPSSALKLVKSVRADYSRMAKWQLVAKADKHDHAPVVFHLRADLCHPEKREVASKRVSQAAMMEAWLTGRGRAEFSCGLEAAIQQVDDATWHAAANDTSPCQYWELLKECMYKAGEAAFPCVAKAAIPGTDEFVGKKHELLRTRATLRRVLPDSEQLERVQLELVMVTRRLRVLRQKRKRELRALWEDEVWEAWRQRRHFKAHQLRGSLAGTGWTTRKRHYWAARQNAATSSEWEQLLSRAGNEGGLSATVCHHDTLRIEFEKIRRELDDTALPLTSKIISQVEDDIQAIGRYLVTTRKRKSWPSWGVPVELLLLALLPHYRLPVGRLGVGFKQHVDPTIFLSKFTTCLQMIRRWRWVPLVWHRCCSVALDKPGSTKAGAEALRLIHVFDAAAASWMSAMAKNHEFPRIPSWVHGGVPHRSREGALLVQQSASWRLQQLRVSAIMLLFDGRNAFGSSDLDGLRTTCDEWLGDDSMFAKDVYDLAEMVIPTLDGEIRMRPKAGLMGHTLAPKTFVGHYTKSVAKWNATMCLDQPALVTRCPITNTLTDLSIGLFVDDIQKVVVAKPEETLRELALRTVEVGQSLGQVLDEGGYGLNKDKSVAVLGLKGAGSIAVTRQIIEGKIEVYGRAAKFSRYLGPLVSLSGSHEPEINARIRAARRAWFMAGKVWWCRSLPFRFVRMLLICLIQNTLLSAMTVFKLNEGAIRTLDMYLCGRLRSVMKFRQPLQFEGRRAGTLTVYRFWRIADIFTELRVRRLREVQRWSAKPEQHSAELAAVFGTSRCELDRGISRLQDGKINKDSATPWAVQMQTDLLVLGTVLEAEDWCQRVVADIREIFRDGWVRDDFLHHMDVAILRAASWGHRPAHGTTNLEDGEPQHKCLFVDESGRGCDCRFFTHKGMLAHVRRSRKFVDRTTSLVLTNQCPFCMSSFVNRAAAISHVKSTTRPGGKCLVDHSPWQHDVIVPSRLVCPVCDVAFAVLEHLQCHIRSHLPSPLFIAFSDGLEASGTAGLGLVGTGAGSEERSGRGRGRGERRRRQRRQHSRDGGQLAEALAVPAADVEEDLRGAVDYVQNSELPGRRFPRARGRTVVPRAGVEGPQEAQTRQSSHPHRDRGVRRDDGHGQGSGSRAEGCPRVHGKLVQVSHQRGPVEDRRARALLAAQGSVRWKELCQRQEGQQVERRQTEGRDGPRLWSGRGAGRGRSKKQAASPLAVDVPAQPDGGSGDSRPSGAQRVHADKDGPEGHREGHEALQVRAGQRHGPADVDRADRPEGPQLAQQADDQAEVSRQWLDEAMRSIFQDW